jgi:hypothetical protein
MERARLKRRFRPFDEDPEFRRIARSFDPGDRVGLVAIRNRLGCGYGVRARSVRGGFIDFEDRDVR